MNSFKIVILFSSAVIFILKSFLFFSFTNCNRIWIKICSQIFSKQIDFFFYNLFVRRYKLVFLWNFGIKYKLFASEDCFCKKKYEFTNNQEFEKEKRDSSSQVHRDEYLLQRFLLFANLPSCRGCSSSQL